MYKVRVINGYFSGCLGTVEGFHFNEAIVNLEVEHHNRKDVVRILLKAKDYKAIEEIN